MNILQIKPLAERFGCEIDTDGNEQVVVIHEGEPHRIGSVLSVSDMKWTELQAIFESVSGTSIRGWWGHDRG